MESVISAVKKSKVSTKIVVYGGAYACLILGVFALVLYFNIGRLGVHVDECKNSLILILEILGTFTLLILLGLFFILRYFSTKIETEITSLTAMICDFNFAINCLQVPDFPHQSLVKLNELCDVLHTRMSRNLRIFLDQQEFVENAAHELQTPLAIFHAQIDELMQHPFVNEEMSVVFNAINENISRMYRLNHNLLLLSKMEHDVYLDLELISINKLITDQLSFFNEQGLHKNITVKINFECHIEVNSNLILTEVLIRNLFMNAIRHNIDNGFLLVSLEHPNRIVFSNSGTEAVAENRIFNRFYKKNVADSRGSGLGLAIIKRVVEINGWTIEYQFNNGMHHFVILV